MPARTLLAVTSFGLASVVVSLVAQAPDGRLPASTQASSAARRFEVASVKPNQRPIASRPLIHGIRTLPGGRLTATFVTLRALILSAFDIKDYQLEGGPSWVGSSNFDINAKADGDATPEEFSAMLKALLMERFSLRTRTEPRLLGVYELTFANS
jgi:uncharacterized protein (TIGR03435 family)